MRTSYTAVVERNIPVQGQFQTEPYECGWADEAIIFLRTLEGDLSGVNGFVQISPDGMNWCNEGSVISLPGGGETSFVKVRHFGNWLRLRMDTGAKTGTVLVTLHLKE